jgi:hypothetical protein
MRLAAQDTVPPGRRHWGAGPRIVEEGVYKGRKWVRYENGTVAAELMGGRFKEFGSVEEFQRYIA